MRPGSAHDAHVVAYLLDRCDRRLHEQIDAAAERWRASPEHAAFEAEKAAARAAHESELHAAVYDQELLAELEGQAERAAIRAADEPEPPDPTKPPPFETCRAEAIDIDAETPWLVRGLLPAGACTLLIGDPKAGKSWLADDLAVAVASATPVLGHVAPARSGVLFVLAEDSPRQWGRRLHGLALARGLPGRTGLALDHVVVEALRVDNDHDVARLRSTIEATKAALVVLDPLAMLHGADENSAPEMLEVLRRVRGLARSTGAAILVTHHTNKPNGISRRMTHRIRGSTALHGWADVILMLEHVESGPAKGALRLSVEARDFEAPRPLGLRRQVGTSPEGRPIYWHEVVDLQEREEEEAEGTNAAREARAPREDLQERVVEALEDAGGQLSRSRLAESVKGRRRDVFDAISALVDSGVFAEVGSGSMSGVKLVRNGNGCST